MGWQISLSCGHFRYFEQFKSGNARLDSNVLKTHNKVNAFQKKNCVSGRRDASKVSMVCVIASWLSDSELECNRRHCEHRLEPFSAAVTLFPWVFRRRWHKPVWLDLKPISIGRKQELAELSYDRTLLLQFNRMSILLFWVACSQEYPLLSDEAVNVLLPVDMICNHLLTGNSLFCGHWHEHQMQIKMDHWGWY